MSIGSPASSGETIDEDYLLLHLSKQIPPNPYRKNHRPLEESVVVNEFLAYVKEHNPELLSAIDIVGQAERFLDAQRMLGMTEKLFLRARNRLSVLYSYFQDGSTPPRQRKVYRTRKEMTAIRVAKATRFVEGVCHG